MGEKKRILWVGDGGVASGFARVNHSIIENLSDDWEIHHLAVNYYGDPYPAGHYMYPADAHGKGDPLGFNRVRELIEKVQPDIIFILNDPWVIFEYLRLIDVSLANRVVAYTPVDAKPLQLNWVATLDKIKQLITYTEFGKTAFTDLKPDFHEIEVIPHGIDRDKFFPIDRDAARKAVGEAIPADGFIVFDGNRNQERKRVDRMIKAFGQFAEGKDDVYLYLHMGLEDAGWNVRKLARRYGIKDGQLIMTSPGHSPANYVSDETLNVIYNAMDVGVTPSSGEGWGLLAFEQGLCGVPQIVPNSSAPAEIFPDSTVLKTDIAYTEPYVRILTEASVISIDSLVENLNTYYYDKELRQQHGKNIRQHLLQPQYDWKNVAKRFQDVFERVYLERVRNDD